MPNPLIPTLQKITEGFDKESGDIEKMIDGLSTDLAGIAAELDPKNFGVAEEAALTKELDEILVRIKTIQDEIAETDKEVCSDFSTRNLSPITLSLLDCRDIQKYWLERGRVCLFIGGSDVWLVDIGKGSVLQD